MQQRGAAVIKARKLSSAMSAAKAICDHMRDIWSGTPEVKQFFRHATGYTVNTQGRSSVAVYKLKLKRNLTIQFPKIQIKNTHFEKPK